MGDAKISSSLIADGCRIGNNVTIENSVIGLRTVIGDNVTIKDSVIMGADDIETDRQHDADRVPLGIGSGTVIRGTILDKNCRIGENVAITNSDAVQNQGEDEAVQIRDGISIVIKNAVVESGYRS
jgi:glucose-1-phosphate adenylyltransferase